MMVFASLLAIVSVGSCVNLWSTFSVDIILLRNLILSISTKCNGLSYNHFQYHVGISRLPDFQNIQKLCCLTHHLANFLWIQYLSYLDVNLLPDCKLKCLPDIAVMQILKHLSSVCNQYYVIQTYTQYRKINTDYLHSFKCERHNITPISGWETTNDVLKSFMMSNCKLSVWLYSKSLLLDNCIFSHNLCGDAVN